MIPRELLTADPDLLRCPTCGYVWCRDDHPVEHSCIPGLVEWIAILDERKAYAVKKLQAVRIAEGGEAQSTRTNHGASITL